MISMILTWVFIVNTISAEDLSAYGRRGEGETFKKGDAALGKDVKLASYEITTSDDVNAGSISSYLIWVFWNNEIYQSTLYNPLANNVHSFNAYMSFKYNDYNYKAEPKTKAKMMIQNSNNDDAAIFTSMKLIMSDGTFYEVDGFCGNAESLGTYYENFVSDVNTCGRKSGYTQYDAICVDGNPGTVCNPSNVMIYFDKLNPNTVSNTANLVDTTGQITEGCQLIVSPHYASKCATKTREKCESSRGCDLVSKTFGTFGGSIKAQALVQSHGTVFNENKSMISDYLLLGVLAISASINVIHVYYNCKPQSKV